MRLLTALALAMAPLAAVSGAEPDADAAAATLCGTQLRQTIATMRENGIRIDDNRFLELLERVYRGEMIDSLTTGDAEAILRMAGGLNRQSGPLPPRDEAAENAWVARQAELPRAVVLPSGVVLQKLVEGSGPQPGRLDDVMVTYTGKLSSGEVFDVTEEPFCLPMYNIVPGLRAAMMEMHMGGTYRVFIPPAQAYGPQSIMDVIPAWSALEFYIEPIEIKKTDK